MDASKISPTLVGSDSKPFAELVLLVMVVAEVPESTVAWIFMFVKDPLAIFPKVQIPDPLL